MRASACGMLVATLVVFGCARQQPLGPAAETQAVHAMRAEATPDQAAWREQWSQRNDVQAEIALLKSPDPLERARAAARLRDLAGSGGDSRDISAAVPDLIAMLTDETPLRSTHVHPLRSADLPTTPGDEAALTLGSVKPAPVEALRGVLQQGPSETVLARVIRAAGRGRIEALADVVEDALDHPSGEVRLTAYWTIQSVAPTEAAAMLAASAAEEQELLAPLLVTLSRVDLEAAMAALDQAMGDPVPERRREAAQAIGDIQAPESRERFIPRLARALSEEPSAEVRERQAWALSRGRAHGELVAEALLTVLRGDPAPEVRASAASSLGNLDTVPAELRAEALLAALDDDRKVQDRAMQALNRMVRDGEITPAPMPDLVTRLRDRIVAALTAEEDVVASWAPDILTRMPVPGTVDTLFELLAARRSVYEVARALVGLAEADPRLLPALDELIDDQAVPEEVRRALAERARWVATGESGHPDEDPLQWWREHRAEYLD